MYPCAYPASLVNHLPLSNRGNLEKLNAKAENVPPLGGLCRKCHFAEKKNKQIQAELFAENKTIKKFCIKNGEPIEPDGHAKQNEFYGESG